ncbi:MAG TPA: cytochrome c [Candidatus Acidoferrales bacterium]|jgi:mono/diheme cytochrome c family protein|nr:cytochrome c [Candidatus Acidoferrales bacterium]
MSPDKNPGIPKNKLLLGVSVVFAIVAAAGSIILYATRDWNAPAAARNLQNPVPPTVNSIREGMTSYSTHCQSCHGERGDGKGPRAEKLSIAPTNFTDAHAMGQVTDGELFWKISHGRRPMPSFQDKLTERERWQLVDYIRTLAQKPASGAASATNSTSP